MNQTDLIGLGWQIAVTLAVCTGLGYLLDRWLDTLPWFLVGGSVFGLVSVFVQIFRITSQLNEPTRREEE